MSITDQIRSQLDRELITIEGCLVHGRLVDVTLTREQARKVLDGGELVVQDGKVVVR